jgi:catechol 2,3-dioxygenase-like lactoylglutathione lyase family enzyme
VHIEKLDHIALWVAERDRIAEILTGRFGMHQIERTEAFTLVGSDARRGKLTLFAAEGPRKRGALAHVGLRVSDAADREDEVELPDELVLRLVEAPTEVEYDLDHVALFSRVPEETAERYLALGFEPAEPASGGEPRVQVGGAFVEFREGDPGDPERPLLNHLAVLVTSADEQLEEANALGLEIADVVDAANTKAFFVWGPERVKIEYVEHKPSFSLA